MIEMPKWGQVIDWNRWKRMDEYEKFDSYRKNIIKHYLKKAKYYPSRARVTPTKFKAIMREELLGRIKNYIQNNMKKRILCIVGESGVGKTLVSLHLKNKLGANTICSYTTRPPREDEEEGRDHHFIDIVPPQDEILAYTYFGGYEYYATKAQVQGPCTVYVIDENGLRDFKERWENDYEIFSMYIQRDRKLRNRLGIDRKRMVRDNERDKFDLDFYDYVITNNGSKEDLFKQVDAIYLELSKTEE